MARHVFFSFHFQRDIFRVNIVRKSFLTQGGYDIAGYYDRSLWEKAKSTSDLALKRMINTALKRTTVTVVLIGRETANREWVQYEIEKSWERGNGLLGIYIHNLRHPRTKQTDLRGPNPFDNFEIIQESSGLYRLPTKVSLSKICLTYDWVLDRGYYNFNTWVEQAARQAKSL